MPIIKQSKVSAELSRDQWDKLYKEGKVTLMQIPEKHRAWVQGNNSKLKQRVTDAIDDFGGKYALPFVSSLAFGPAGGVGYLANVTSDMAVSAATKGEKQTFGDLFVDPKEHPYLNAAVNMLNPVNFVGSYDAAPVARTINELSSAGRAALKQASAIAEKIPSLAERKLFKVVKNQDGFNYGGTEPVYMSVPQTNGNTLTVKQIKFDPKRSCATEVGEEVVIPISKNMKQEKATDLINRLSSKARDMVDIKAPFKAAEKDEWWNAGAPRTIYYANDALRDIERRGLLNELPNWSIMEYMANGAKGLDSIVADSGKDMTRQVKGILKNINLINNKSELDLVKSTFGHGGLYAILQESPQYSKRAADLLKIGMSEEDIVKQLLQDKFTFTRGVSIEPVMSKTIRGRKRVNEKATENLGKKALFTIPDKTYGGRSDSKMFNLGPNEDILYTSNGINTAYQYSYPGVKGKMGFVGVFKRDPGTLNWSGDDLLSWWHNNPLPDNVKRANSTTKRLTESDLVDAYLDVAGNNVRKETVRQFLNTIRKGNIELPLDQSNSFGHFLVSGSRGENFPIQGMYMSDFVPTNGLTVGDLARKLNTTAGEITTRQHYGQATPGFTLGQKQGGTIPKLKIK